MVDFYLGKARRRERKTEEEREREREGDEKGSVRGGFLLKKAEIPFLDFYFFSLFQRIDPVRVASLYYFVPLRLLVFGVDFWYLLLRLSSRTSSLTLSPPHTLRASIA